MSVYNGEGYLKEAIESILNQTCGDFEFLIVNDGSTDKSLEIIQDYQRKDPRIRAIDKPNSGLTKSLNIAIREAKGEFIARQDADDRSDRFRLEKQLAFMQSRPDMVLVGSVAQETGNGSPRIGRFFDETEMPKALLRRNPIPHTSAFFRKEVFVRAGLYDESFQTAQDYEAWLRLADFGKIAMLPEPLVTYRVGDKSISAKKKYRQAWSGFRARKGRVSLPDNLRATAYQIIANTLPSWAIRLKRRWLG
ncbi:MAG: glycosyltransferase [Campylobacterales bacterium]